MHFRPGRREYVVVENRGYPDWAGEAKAFEVTPEKPWFPPLLERPALGRLVPDPKGDKT